MKCNMKVMSLYIKSLSEKSQHTKYILSYVTANYWL